MVAVDPDFQGRGIGSNRVELALDWMKDAGMSIAMVETVAHPRRTKEKLGFRVWAVARYFKTL